MVEQHDPVTSVEGYLEFLCEDAGVGPETITDPGIGKAVLEPQFESQMDAIRCVMERNYEAEQKVSAEIERLDVRIREHGGNICRTQHRGTRFDCAAHGVYI